MAEPVPFKIAVSDEQLEWINQRVRTARIPPGKDAPEEQIWQEQGLPASYARHLQDYWANSYDWRRIETQLNAELEQFTLPISHADEEHTIHFVHHRAKKPSAIPLLFIHGWPGSFLEVRKIIALLTDPEGDDQQAYHVVAPSLPGFGFSSYPRKHVCPPWEISSILTKLMHALSYNRFVVQGGDWGSMIGRLIATDSPASVLGLHLNFIIGTPPSPIWHPLAVAKLARAYLFKGAGLTAYEKTMFERMQWWNAAEAGYQKIQGTKPQTLNYGLVDSPLGMLCWLREKVQFIVDREAGFEWDDEEVVTWCMPYILNGTAGHSEIYMCIPKEGSSKPEDKMLLTRLFDKIISRTVPVGVSVFPKDVAFVPKWWAESKVAENIAFWKEREKGGHFPSVERPKDLVEDVRAFTVAANIKL
ncbi:epoxide hydrolase domain-containing protein [Bimuria novae-zelandiae CBS 107.79]|uniref:Epoxide hydrolase domain-containing protein n=1 Tax=Bimuria novae-zelandiae CBS 107.79 TaxID=1447943 RepID=A0A6A5UZS1_9PLEO|nr:epoxide hydrolase domain-containing protein [Bimuria novae-zelandiae CBS 107.79]